MIGAWDQMLNGKRRLRNRAVPLRESLREQSLRLSRHVPAQANLGQHKARHPATKKLPALTNHIHCGQ